jgi:hypothetical protein
MAKTRASQSGGSTTLMVVVAVVFILGLMVYLSRASKASVPATPAMDDAGTGDMGPMAPAVLAADFGADMQNYVGQDINLQRVNVAQIMSPEVIWVDVPTPQGSTPFPVKLPPGTSAPTANSSVDIEGRVLEKTDSVVSAWQASGAIQNADQRAQAEYGMYFLDAKAVRPAN